jgi:hypothetical protein
MVKQIAAKTDTMMTGYPGRTFENSATYANAGTTIRRILDAFEGVMDTIQFAGGVKAKGTHRLLDVPFLRANPLAVPAKITPLAVEDITPDQFVLQQNYPNPFNPMTTIEFNLPNASTVTLKIYNLLGQEVATVLDHQNYDDGVQQVDFDASSLASGMYFYRVTAQSVNDDGVQSTFSSVKKMMLVK